MASDIFGSNLVISAGGGKVGAVEGGQRTCDKRAAPEGKLTARCREKKARREPGASGGLRRGVAKPREPSAPTAAVGAAPGPVSSILALQVVGGGAEGCRRRSVQQPLSPAPAETSNRNGKL